jgi:hypothetical protein
MKARKADAQALIDEAVRHDATLAEALHYAGRQIRAALRAKRVYEAELHREREVEEMKQLEAEEAGDEFAFTLAARLWGPDPDPDSEDL